MENEIINYYIGRGFLHSEKQKIAEELRGKPIDTTEIRLCPYVYYSYINCEMGYGKMKEEEFPIREQWIKDGILEDSGFPEFTDKGLKFVEFVLEWAYPKDYLEMVKGVK